MTTNKKDFWSRIGSKVLAWFLLGAVVLDSSYALAANTVEANPSTERSVALPEKLNVGIVLFPGFEALDVYGPLEMWAYIPDFNVVMIAEEAGPVASGQGVATVATHSFADAPPLDIVMVPGGMGSRAQLSNERLLDYLRKVDRTTQYTTSVCTGSALLAKAGLLDGHRATTNKRAFFMAEEQSSKVDWVVDARWVESGKMFTSSGVSAGTDTALGLIAKMYGRQVAHELAESLEYTWHERADVDPFAVFVNRLKADEAQGPAELLKTEPISNGSVATAPNYLRLYFNKRPLVDTSHITLRREDATGTSIRLEGIHHMGQNDLMISVTEPLAAGTYVVDWRADFNGAQEPITGSYSFNVEP